MRSEQIQKSELLPVNSFTKDIYSIRQFEEKAGILKLFPSFSLTLKKEKRIFSSPYSVDVKEFKGDFFDVDSERRMAKDVIKLLNTILTICQDKEGSVLQFLAKSAVPHDWILSRVWEKLNIPGP
ncbi:MAG: hypothetical protein ABI758_00480 [Candidatus Woesebacteria bacterium]